MISVIIPAYNVEKYIVRTLESLKDQTFRPIEVIVVNDGSTDRTSEIARNILSESDLIWKVIDQENKGVSIARNVGLLNANGEYVHFLDGDDYVHEAFIEKMYKKAKKFNCDIVFCKYNWVLENGETFRSYDDMFSPAIMLKLSEKPYVGVSVLKEYLKRRIHLWTGSVIYKRDFLVKNFLNYTPKCWYGEDIEFIMKALAKARRVISVSETLAFYLQHESSCTARKGMYWERFMEVVEMFKRMESFFRQHNINSDILKLLEDYRKQHLYGHILAIILNKDIKDEKIFEEQFLYTIKDIKPRTFKQLLIKILALFFPMKIFLKLLHLSNRFRSNLKKIYGRKV